MAGDDDAPPQASRRRVQTIFVGRVECITVPHSASSTWRPVADGSHRTVYSLARNTQCLHQAQGRAALSALFSALVLSKGKAHRRNNFQGTWRNRATMRHIAKHSARWTSQYKLIGSALPVQDARGLAVSTTPIVERRWSHANRTAQGLVKSAFHMLSTSTAAHAAEAKKESEVGVELKRKLCSTNADRDCELAEPLPDFKSMMAELRPQLTFDVPPDNSESPFVPPHRSSVAPAGKGVPHPMENEIADALSREKSMPVSQPTPFTKLKDVDEPAWIDTPEALHVMADQLMGERAIAVDLEHHDMHSFMGFTCVLQISTRQHDWVVDTIRLRSHIHGALAGVFEDPNVVKVLHGGNSDVTWLERDFGIYVVNMFDTYLAALVLGEKAVALNDLQALYCGFVTSKSAKKHMQRSDWRKRPLTDKKLKYARSDTHFLLYIYDRLRLRLVDVDKLSMVLEASAKYSRKRYVKPARNLIKIEEQGIARGFNVRQLHLLRTLVNWRYEEARAQDESLFYIMENCVIFELAKYGPQSKDDVRKALDLEEKKSLPKYVGAAPTLKRLLNVIHKATNEEMEEEWVKTIEERMEKFKIDEAKKAAAIIAAEKENDEEENFDAVEGDKMDVVNDDVMESEKVNEADDDVLSS